MPPAAIPLADPPAPSGRAIIDAVKAAGIGWVVALPDIVTSDGLLWPLSREPGLRLVRVCKEDEGVSICAGLGYTGQRSLLLMQHTGLLDSLNAIRAIGVEYRRPICMMVGLQGKEPALLPAQSRSIGVRMVEPILAAMTIATHLIQEPADVAKVGPAVDAAYAQSAPVVFLIGRSPQP